MSVQNPLEEWARERVDKINEAVKRPASEPLKIETEGVFDPSLLDSAGYPLPPDDQFTADPLKMLVGSMRDLIDVTMRPPSGFLAALPKAEHKVRIFRLNDRASLSQIENAIEEFLNDGYCCHTPTVVNDFVIMDFSRRKETEENEREQQTRTDHS